MFKKIVLALVLVAFAGVKANAAESPLQQIADALDVSTTKTFQFTANGKMWGVAQATSPMAANPRAYIRSLTRVYDFTAGAMRDELVRTQGEAPPSGGDYQPIEGEQRMISLVSGDLAWNESGKDMIPATQDANERAHAIVVSPHGLLRAAFANNATVAKRTIDGREMTVISFTVPGKHKVVAYANDQNAIEKVESLYGHPVVGDMKVVTYYGPYRDFAGVKFPTKIIQYQDGLPSLDVTVSAVRANPTVDIAVPGNVRSTPVTVKSEKVADGVWFIGGGSHNSVLIEMKDYLIVIEAPLDDVRSSAVMGEVKKLVSGKPVKYLVNTHHHIDHSGGVRAYAAEGITIVTHELSRPFFEKALANTWTLSPDRLAKSKKKPVFQTMGDNMVLTDGARSVELYQIVGSGHHDGLVMAYLRKEKLLVEADAFSPFGVPKTPNPYSVNLEANVRRLNIDVERILPLHGEIVPYVELMKAIGKDPAAAKKPPAK
ncbi:MAG TPA: MBL fold metallo-hydrolase [Candidatus Binatia bacterium]|nr:MBL fold metallo-hydrolase [Candidatus Binatia bacterium]